MIFSMTQQHAIQLIWDYMHMGHQVKKADVIMVFGSTDTMPAERAAELWHEGWAPYIVCSGSGTIHNEKSTWSKFKGSTEAEVMAAIIRDKGVPQECILIENQSQNTGQNFEFTANLLKERALPFSVVIVVQKPTVERRMYATGKVRWPDVELIVTSPQVTIEEYAKTRGAESGEYWIHSMVGDLQRVKEYPAQGFQVEQEIPKNVLAAYKYLVEIGYTDCLIG